MWIEWILNQSSLNFFPPLLTHTRLSPSAAVRFEVCSTSHHADVCIIHQAVLLLRTLRPIPTSIDKPQHCIKKISFQVVLERSTLLHDGAAWPGVGLTLGSFPRLFAEWSGVVIVLRCWQRGELKLIKSAAIHHIRMGIRPENALSPRCGARSLGLDSLRHV